MNKVFLFIILAVLVAGAAGQTRSPGFDLSNYGVRIEPDKRLIVVLAALEMATSKTAAGVDEKLIKTPLSEMGSKFREQLVHDVFPPDLNQRRRLALLTTVTDDMAMAAPAIMGLSKALAAMGMPRLL